LGILVKFVDENNITTAREATIEGNRIIRMYTDRNILL
jgi:hypothetical protein